MNRLITLTGMLVLVLLALLPGCTGAPSTTTVSHTVTTTQDNPVTTTVTETAIPATVTNTHTVTATSTVTTIPPYGHRYGHSHHNHSAPDNNSGHLRYCRADFLSRTR